MPHGRCRSAAMGDRRALRRRKRTLQSCRRMVWRRVVGRYAILRLVLACVNRSDLVRQFRRSVDAAISIEGIGKRYQIGATPNKYRTLRDSLANIALAPARRLRHAGSSTGRVSTIWAVRDVSFDVAEGEAIGIIGRNGAGKSTLLKILSRITPPTEGRIHLHGRVGSLLEVGTGFHPELTGRENIYLNGAILGMGRAEIVSKFDEMVEFAEIGPFLDTPVKRYSSGMYVRLAFAVAAHLEPEILIVDEVLSVGDLAFQRKCLGKMESVTEGGRTVVFVSHNMQAVRSLCSRAVQIKDGRVIDDGPANDVVDAYMSMYASQESSATWLSGEGPGDDDVRLTGMSVHDWHGRGVDVVTSSQPFVVRVGFDVHRLDDALCVGFDLRASDGSLVFRTYQTDADPEAWPQLTVGHNTLDCHVPPGLLNDGRYDILPRVSLHRIRWIVNSDAVASFQVQRDPGQSPYTRTPRPGITAPCLTWTASAEPYAQA